MGSVLDSHGPVAAAIENTWWLMFWGALAVFTLVMGLLVYAMFAPPERRPGLRAQWFIAGGGIVFPAVVLTALLIYGTATGRMLVTPAESSQRIEIVGHQWWWEVRYPAGNDRPAVMTANEIHVPAGVPIEALLTSADVIHSFWVPALAGKMDLIPGRENTFRFEADREGDYRGQCAEFCGTQHARMGLRVIAVSPERFADWLDEQAKDAMVTEGEGYEAFVSGGCHGCHAIRGTDAQGALGPDLTHVASRRTLGAGTVANDRDGLRRWLEGHGSDLKPGNRGAGYAPADEALLEAIVDYLEQLE